MKKAVVLVVLLALAFGYGVTTLAKGKVCSAPPTHECWIQFKCFEFGCYTAKCCTDCVWVFKKGECVEVCETTCSPIY